MPHWNSYKSFHHPPTYVSKFGSVLKLNQHDHAHWSIDKRSLLFYSLISPGISVQDNFDLAKRDFLQNL